MAVTLSLWSTKQGEIRRFLESYYQNGYHYSDEAQRWIEKFFKPMESIDMISALMDNIDKYNIVMYVHMENGYLFKITKYNYNDVIRGLISIYYQPA